MLLKLLTVTKDARSGFTPRVVCKDGYNVSIQSGPFSYCTPRTLSKNAANYTHFELGYPSVSDELLDEYAENSSDYTDTVYSQVPIEVILELVDKHGGVNLPEDFVDNEEELLI